MASLLEVGTGFHPELTGRENTYLNGSILGMRKGEIDRKFDEIVAFAEVEPFIDTPVKHYSSGMRVRLAFAVAAHLEPEILLVDEVLAVGDASFQKKSLGKMESVAQEGRTVLFVSHQMTAIRSLTERTLCLEAGRLVADGPTEAVVAAYLQRTTQRAQTQPLAQRSDRVGSGEVRLTDLRILDGQGRLMTQVPMGAPLVLEAAYTAQTPISTLELCFFFVDPAGHDLPARLQLRERSRR